MGSQSGVRERLKFYLMKTGVTQTHICRQIDIPKSIMSRFIHGKVRLYDYHYGLLDEFLKKNNY